MISLKDKKRITVTNPLDDSRLKPYEISVYKGSEFYNRSLKSGLQVDDEDNSIHNEDNSGKRYSFWQNVTLQIDMEQFFN